MVATRTFERPEVNGKDEDTRSDECHLELMIPPEEILVVEYESEADEKESERCG